MGRGVSSGGGQSSLGYLFGSGEAPKPASTNGTSPNTSSEVPQTQNEVAKETPQKPTTTSPVAGASKEIPAGIPSPVAGASKEIPAGIPSPVAGASKEIPAGIPGNNANNYFRADGQNCGNFLTDRPTTKVHAAPGGGSSLDYLFGGSEK